MLRKKRTKSENLRHRVERKFQQMKHRANIKERYGVFTQKMLEDLFDKTLTTKLNAFVVRINDVFATKDDLSNFPTKDDLRKLDSKLDWLITAYKKFDEEHTLLSNKSSENEDRLDIIEKRLNIVVQ